MTPDAGGRGSPERLRGRRVVLVDDDPAVLGVLAAGLEQAGCEVKAFNRFDDAKRYLATVEPPDFLVTDVRLAGFNGLQLAVTCKLKRPEMVAVVMTGYDDVVLRKDAEAAGAHFVVKPLVPSELIDLLVQHAG